MAHPGFGPPSLPVGTEVSAKYRGAFCEAKVKSVTRVVKCKVLVKDGQSSMFVNDDEVKGAVKLGAVVEVKHPDTGQPVEATINKMLDHSTYTVVFDDGDERTLRRTQLCLKGDKHFIESETLDNLPLSHPEHFGTPVLQNKKAKRKNDADSDDGEEISEGESPRRAMYRGRHQELVGKLMLVDLPHRKGSVIPALVVLPDANSLSEVKNRDQILVRSFKDSKFMTVTRKDLKDFSRTVAIKNDDKTMRTAYEKALLYHDTKELPVGWDKEEMLGSDVEDEEEDEEDDEYASEDEPYEEKDRFVAQLYKFMDDRGTPINKGPCIGNKDLNLYKLFKIVQNLGGYNKVTKEMKWPLVYSKMGLPSLHLNPAHQIKAAYKKYLDAYETFYRKLGSTMGTLSRPGRARQNSGRSILNFRAREKSPRSPKPPEKSKEAESSETPKAKPDHTSDKSEDSQDAVSVTSTDDGDIATRRTPRREAKNQAAKEESKEKKEEAGKGKKDEKKEEAPKSKKDDNITTPKTKKDDTPTPTPKAKKDEPSTAKAKKDEAAAVKAKKDDVAAAKGRKEEPTPTTSKSKKEEPAKAKKDEESSKKEEKKPTRKLVKAEEEPEKEEKKSARVAKKEKEEKEEEKKEDVKPQLVTLVVKESPKKRVTRRKLLPTEVKKEVETKEEVEEKKEPPKKSSAKEVKVVEKKEKEIPRTLERRDSKAAEKKEAVTKVAEKKEAPKPAEKKGKASEEKKPKKEKKSKEEGTDEGTDQEEEETVEAEKPDTGSGKYDYPIGSKLKVKYGRGKNQKTYIAKVVDYGKDGIHKTYLVHYAGWNNRYDEWIRSDRVVSVLDKPDGEKAKTPPTKSQPIPSGLKKISTLDSAPATKAGPAVKKPGQVFRTPKMVGAKTRATRSSSSETSAATKKTDKRMTRRRSFLTDSTGSKSPESHISSDADEATGSERADDDDNTKEYKDEEDDILDVEEEEAEVGEDTGKEKSLDLDTSLEEDVTMKEESASSEIESEKIEEEEDSKEMDLEPKRTEVKEVSESESSKAKSVPVELMKQEVELKREIKEPVKAEVVKEVSSKPVVEPTKVAGPSETKSERATVVVAEVKNPVDEIKSAVYEELDSELERKEEEEVSEKVSVPTIADVYLESDSSESPKLEIVDEREPEVKESIIEKPESVSVQPEKLPEELSAPVLVPDQSIPQLRKMDIEPEKKEPEKTKVGRGRKKEQAKDAKKSTKSNEAGSSNIAQEIPTLEPMIRDPIINSGKIDPSPYDFDAEVDTPWHPEITKKWEPTQKAPIVVKENKELLAASEEGDEKEKKKVKKKAKKKPISPEFVGEEGSLSVEESSAITATSETAASPASGDVASEKQGSKKKGRKKKEVSPETAKEVIEQYESTVNSVVEAVKHSLKESESDNEQRPAVKRRRVKRLSEGDKKDVTVRVGKMARKTASRESLDSLDSGKVEEKSKRVAVPPSPVQNEPSSSKSNVNEAASAAVASVSEAEESCGLRESKREPSFCESQGFEPHLDQHDPSAPFDNTPPTTPEYEEEGATNAAMQHQQSTYHSDDLSSKSDIQKDSSAKVICSSSSAVSSISLPASSANLAPSKSASESPSDNDVTSTTSTDNLDSTHTAQQSESSGTDQDIPSHKKRKAADETVNGVSVPKKKKRVHGTRSRTAKKSPKYTGNSDSQGSASNTPNHCPESPPTKFADLSKSPRPSKYNFNADLGEYLEGEARCNFLISKMREIKAIYMNLKSEVASIDRRRKRARRKERESSQVTANDKESAT